MENVGHSPLLKFFSDTKPTMSNPEIKLQVSLDNPNIESNVPGEQELRDDSKMEKDDISNVKEHTEDKETVTEAPGDQKPAVDEAKEANEDINKTNAESSESDANKELATKEDFVLTPVVTITKNEAVFTKGDLKLQKISVTEDISVRFQHLFKKETKPGKTVVTQVQAFEYKY